jgi:hypothetical protein
MVGQERVLVGASYPLGTQRLEQDKFPWPETEREYLTALFEKVPLASSPLNLTVSIDAG